MIKTVGLVVKRDDLTHDEFVKHFRETHVELGKRLPGIKKYTTSVPTEEQAVVRHRPGGSRDVSVPDGGVAEYDIVSEIWFDDLDAFHNAFDSEASKEAFDDEKNFIKEIYFLVVEEEVHLNDL